MPPPRKRRLRRSPIRFPACLSRPSSASLLLRSSSGCSSGRRSATRSRAASLCSSSAARAHSALQRRLLSWSAAAWARKTASCSKPPFRSKRQARCRSSHSIKPAPSQAASPASRIFYPPRVLLKKIFSKPQVRSRKRASTRSPKPSWRALRRSAYRQKKSQTSWQSPAMASPLP